jgi:large subunit ribosomal protein L15
MPLIRRMPKRGFNNVRHTVRYVPVNLEALNRFPDGTVVDAALLVSSGLANGGAEGVKILGTGKLERRIVVKANAFSASAKARIEALGGTCEVAPAR